MCRILMTLLPVTRWHVTVNRTKIQTDRKINAVITKQSKYVFCGNQQLRVGATLEARISLNKIPYILCISCYAIKHMSHI